MLIFDRAWSMEIALCGPWLCYSGCLRTAGSNSAVFLAGPESLVFPAAQLGYLTMRCVRAQKQQM